MKLIETELKGVFIIENFYSLDERGSFTKIYQKVFFEKSGLCNDFEESFYSISKNNVIRGMHFQLPPHDHDKLVHVAKGEVIDVVLDLRKNSETFGNSISLVLNDKNLRSLYIPKGLAHGFRSMSDDTIMIYNVSTIYNNEADFGVHFDSFNFNWELSEPIVSERDKLLISFEEFNKCNPF